MMKWNGNGLLEKERKRVIKVNRKEDEDHGNESDHKVT
jgi:hypothetical protein